MNAKQTALDAYVARKREYSRLADNALLRPEPRPVLALRAEKSPTDKG